jgi:hypothetical protein
MSLLRVTCSLACSLLIIAFSLPSSAQVIRISTPNSTIPEKYFGMHIHGMVIPRPRMRAPGPWPSVPFGSWRLLSGYVDWPNLEPSRGQWSFGTLDKYVSLADEHHVEILLPLVLSPPWASSRPQEKSSYSPGNAAPPRDLNDWRDYVQKVATRYKGKVHSYEIWNEPNLKDFFTDTPQEMVVLTREASKILKRIDPTVTIVSPSATHADGLDWLDQFLQLGGGDFVDVIGYHFYANTPEAMIPLIEGVHKILTKHGLGNRPLWNTETGWRISNHKTEIKPPGLSDDDASAYVARANVLAWAYGVSRFYWYAWDDGTAGLTEADGATPKPPAKVYSEIENWLVGVRMTHCDRDRGTWTCALEGDGGYSGWIVWDAEGTRSFPIQPTWGARQARDLEGRTKNIAGAKTLEIGPKPLLLEKQAR